MENIEGISRSGLCAEFNENNVGQTVTLMGWAGKVRDIGQLVFIDLRDRSGIMQLVVEQDDEALLKKAQGVHLEYVIAAIGEIRMRSSINPNIPTGKVEVKVKELRVLSKSEPLPVQENAKEENRLQYRYLDLRRPEMQSNLILRHKVANMARNFYSDNGFLEIETPMLIKSTPEGARDYIVPSRVHNGKFYALPQSPQVYKQLLMISGMDRYFQIAKCFRDEDLRADRQPEFTQIDLEMSFVHVDDVLEVNERFLQKVFKEVKGIDIQLPLPRMPYREAMERFGSDKPDTRFGLELVDISQVVKGCGFKVFTDSIENGGSVRAINAKGLGSGLTRKTIDALGEFVKTYRAKGLAWIAISEEGVKSPIAKFLSEEEMQAIVEKMGATTGDTIFIVSDKDKVVFDSLGALRLEIAKRFEIIDRDTYNLLWVTEFPMLEYSEEEGRYMAMHHPFTAPMDEDWGKIDSDPGSVRAKAYDIVLNGVELGGGSIRIFNPDMQSKMFEVLGFTPEDAQSRFGFLIDAFKYGAPPHGGMAYGLDRMIMLLTGSESIRDVIAFPKVQNASELMSGAPDFVDAKQLDELAVAITRFEEEE